MANGKILVVGNLGGSVGLARLLPNGNMDETFGKLGMRKLSFGTTSAVYAMALNLGVIVMAGSCDDHACLIRMQNR